MRGMAVRNQHCRFGGKRILSEHLPVVEEKCEARVSDGRVSALRFRQ